MKISIVISAYNEEANIGECLESIMSLMKDEGEIIVVDNTSTDSTATIARKYTKQVFTRENNLMLNRNKNFGFSKATGEWILSLDADERLTAESRKEIAEKITGDTHLDGYLIPRKNIIFGKWIEHGIWWPDYQLRLFRRGRGKFPERHVHELVEVAGETGILTEPMVHHNYTSVAQYLYKLDKIYTENEVKNILSSGKKLHWIDAIRFPVNDFFKTFFFQRGYKDGLHGLVLSILQAFYMEVVFVKVWEKQGFAEHNEKHFLKAVNSEWKKILRESEYWFATSFLEESRSSVLKFYYRIVRKLSS